MDLTPTAVAEWFDRPRLTFVVAENADGIACYGDLSPTADGEVVWLDVRERPGRPGTAASVVAELERHTPPGAVARAVVDSLDDRMLAELDGRLELPSWPEGIVVRGMPPGEERAVHATQVEAFATTGSSGLSHSSAASEPRRGICNRPARGQV